MLHLRHWKTELHPCAKERKLKRLFPDATQPEPVSSSPRISSASVEDQCLTGELYLYKDFVHDEFPDTWKASPSDTKAA